MELRERLNFSDARIVQIASYPSEKGVKCVVMLAASLLPEHAKHLNCGYIYRDGVPVEGLEDVALEAQLRDMELHLPTAHDRKQFDCYFPELIHRIKIKRVEDAKFEVIFRIHEARRRADLDALLESVNKDSFECAIGRARASCSRAARASTCPAQASARSRPRKKSRSRSSGARCATRTCRSTIRVRSTSTATAL